MVDLSRKFDVLVIGGGNAALCRDQRAAGRRLGAGLEGARILSGGNTRIPATCAAP